MNFLLVWVVLGAFSGESLGGESSPPNYRIQIGIAQRAAALVLTPAGRVRLIDPVEGVRAVLAAQKAYRLEPLEKALKLGSMIISPDSRLEPEKAGETIAIGDHRYQGRLILRLNDDRTMTVIEELGIEEYLLGVLPYEMDPDWPVEALKAQAVVARTFAYAHLGKYRRAGFDLTSDTRSQVYKGLGRDSDAVRRAVAETRGEVLGWKGELLPVYYHACCGGRTLDSRSVWGSPSPPPLRGVRDGVCSASPHFRWRAFFPIAEVLAAASQLAGGKLSSIKILGRDAQGDARSFRLAVGGSKIEVSAQDLRRGLGNSELRSSRINTVKKKGAGVEFSGRGSGHGVGLCQWGARLQAQRGKRYEKILKHYFPGSTLSLVEP